MRATHTGVIVPAPLTPLTLALVLSAVVVQRQASILPLASPRINPPLAMTPFLLAALSLPVSKILVTFFLQPFACSLFLLWSCMPRGRFPVFPADHLPWRNFIVLPDTGGTTGSSSGVNGDLEQQLSGLVTSQHHHNNQINQHQSERASSGSSNSGLLVPRYTAANSDFSNRSVSDSSAGESPVGDDLLGNATPTNGFCSSGSYPSSYLGTPVLPASLLYSQLYNAANQNQFHHLHHHHHHHHGGNEQADLQTVMEHLNTRQGDDQTRLGSGQRSVHSAADSASVWRPYWKRFIVGTRRH